ncbi:MAG: hypothetical protein ABH885_01830, partial [Candidatus Omnitrophota bacterium]
MQAFIIDGSWREWDDVTFQSWIDVYNTSQVVSHLAQSPMRAIPSADFRVVAREKMGERLYEVLGKTKILVDRVIRLKALCVAEEMKRLSSGPYDNDKLLDEAFKDAVLWVVMILQTTPIKDFRHLEKLTEMLEAELAHQRLLNAPQSARLAFRELFVNFEYDPSLSIVNDPLIDKDYRKALLGIPRPSGVEVYGHDFVPSLEQAAALHKLLCNAEESQKDDFARLFGVPVPDKKPLNDDYRNILFEIVSSKKMSLEQVDFLKSIGYGQGAEPGLQVSAASLIGKVTGADGGVIEGGFGVARVVGADGQELPRISISHENMRSPLILGLKVGGANKPESMPRDEFVRAVSSRLQGLPAHMKIVNDALMSRLEGVGEVILLDHDKNAGKPVLGVFDNAAGVIYVDAIIVENPLVLVHELTEGIDRDALGAVSKEYENLTMHTLARGAGKDVRNARDRVFADLVNERGSEAAAREAEAAMGYGEYADCLERKLAEMAATDEISMTRKAQGARGGGLLTRSERDLIRMNMAGGETGRRALYGAQDFVDPAGNVRFTQEIRLITDDLRRGTLNIFLIPKGGGIEGEMEQFKVGRKSERKFDRSLGINTEISYIDGIITSSNKEEFKKKLRSAVEEAINADQEAVERGEGRRYPKIFVDCPVDGGHAPAIDEFIREAVSLFPGVDVAGMLVIGSDEMRAGDLVDEVKVLTVGSALLNFARLQRDFNLPEDSLAPIGMRILEFLGSNGIIDAEDFAKMTGPQITALLNAIMTGAKSLRISKIRWEDLKDWKNAQDEVLRAL